MWSILDCYWIASSTARTILKESNAVLEQPPNESVVPQATYQCHYCPFTLSAPLHHPSLPSLHYNDWHPSRPFQTRRFLGSSGHVYNFNDSWLSWLLLFAPTFSLVTCGLPRENDVRCVINAHPKLSADESLMYKCGHVYPASCNATAISFFVIEKYRDLSGLEGS